MGRAGRRRHRQRREGAKSKHPAVYATQPTQPECGQREREGKGREEVQEEKQKGQENRKVTEEGRAGEAAGRNTTCSRRRRARALQPFSAAVLALAVSVSDSWLGAGPYPRAACPAALPCHELAATQAQPIAWGGWPRLEQVIRTSMPPWSLQREGISVHRQAWADCMSGHPCKTQLPCRTQMCTPRVPLLVPTCPVNTPAQQHEVSLEQSKVGLGHFVQKRSQLLGWALQSSFLSLNSLRGIFWPKGPSGSAGLPQPKPRMAIAGLRPCKLCRA